MKTSEIAKVCGVSSVTVCRWARQSGVKIGPRMTIDQLYDLVQCGKKTPVAFALKYYKAEGFKVAYVDGCLIYYDEKNVIAKA